MPINSQVFDAGMRRPASRRMRSPPITRNAAASTVRMYFARTPNHTMPASNRAWRGDGARHSKSVVPGSNRHRYCAAKIRWR